MKQLDIFGNEVEVEEVPILKQEDQRPKQCKNVTASLRVLIVKGASIVLDANITTKHTTNANYGLLAIVKQATLG